MSTVVPVPAGSLPAYAAYIGSNRFLRVLLTIGVTSLSSTTVSPVLLGALVDEVGLSEQQAGFIFAIEQVGYMLGLIWFSWIGHRLRRDRLGVVAMATVLFTCAGTAVVNGPELLTIVRFTCGTGMGLALAILYSAVSARPEPQRDYAIAGVVMLLYAAALLAISGALVQHFGREGLMGLMMLLSAVGLLATRGLPARISPAARDLPNSSNSPSNHTRIALTRLSITLMLIYAGHAALWTYQERIGLSVGLGHDSVGLLLGLSVLGGVVGSGLALKWGLRTGFTAPQVIAYGVLLIAATLMVYGRTPYTFFAGASIIKVAWFFGLPYLQGAIATLDPSGRWLTAAGALQAGGTALGPAIAALVVVQGYAYVGWLSISLYVACILLSTGAFLAMDRLRRA